MLLVLIVSIIDTIDTHIVTGYSGRHISFSHHFTKQLLLSKVVGKADMPTTISQYYIHMGHTCVVAIVTQIIEGQKQWTNG